MKALRRQGPSLDLGAGATLAELLRTGYKRPKEVRFVNSSPKTPIGKILRKELRGQG